MASCRSYESPTRIIHANTPAIFDERNRSQMIPVSELSVRCEYDKMAIVQLILICQ